MEWNWWLILYIIVAIPYIWRLFLQYFLTIYSMSCISIKLRSYLKNIWIWICQCSVWLSIVNSISLVERRGWLCQNGWSAKYSAWNENHMVSARPINFRHTRVYWIYWKSTLGIFFLQHSIWRPLLENELNTKSTALENHWRSQESKIFGGRQLCVVSSPLTVFSRC